MCSTIDVLFKQKLYLFIQQKIINFFLYFHVLF